MATSRRERFADAGQFVRCQPDGCGDGRRRQLTATGLPPASADAGVCVDAFQFAADPGQAAAEMLRILRPGGRFVLTGWQPATPGDTRPPPRLRIGWAPVLREAGLADVRVAARAIWHEAYTRVFRTALELGDHGDDTALAELQDEARELPTADPVRRVVITATAPGNQSPEM